MRTFCRALFVFCTFLVCAVAFADTAASNPDAPQSLAALWPLLGTSLATLAAYGLRYASAKYDFFHNGIGKAAVTLLGMILSAITPLIQAGHFVWAALAWAAMGAVASFIAQLNPSVSGALAADAATAPPSNRQSGKVSLIVMLVIGAIGFALAVMSCGCATGSDGAYQAEANVNSVLGAGYRATKAYVKAADADAVARAVAGKHAEAQTELDQTKTISNTLLRVLDTGSDATDAEDAAIHTAEAVKQKDYSAIITNLVKIGADVVQAFADNGVKLALPGVR